MLCLKNEGKHLLCLKQKQGKPSCCLCSATDPVEMQLEYRQRDAPLAVQLTALLSELSPGLEGGECSSEWAD